MKFTVIICTYLRAQPLLKLLQSIKFQTVYPDQILIVDGSANDETNDMLAQNSFGNLHYFKVDKSQRGLTRQRNFGISKISSDSDVVCFLDDDTILEADYFQKLIKTFADYPEISGIGGVAINENRWIKPQKNKKYSKNHFYRFEGHIYKEGQRNVLRNYFRLQSDLGPGKMPDFSHGRTCGFPLTGKIYEVDLLIGMSMAFRKKVVDSIRFSTYFDGYGLYEDADFSIRALQFGKNVIDTNVQLSHYHAASGRPNKYKYGKMVVRNGWYVWRIKNPKPNLESRLKWNSITILLIFIRFSNVINTAKRKEAFTEAFGRVVGLCSLLLNQPLNEQKI